MISWERGQVEQLFRWMERRELERTGRAPVDTRAQAIQANRDRQERLREARYQGTIR